MKNENEVKENLAGFSAELTFDVSECKPSPRGSYLTDKDVQALGDIECISIKPFKSGANDASCKLVHIVKGSTSKFTFYENLSVLLDMKVAAGEGKKAIVFPFIASIDNGKITVK